MTAPWRLLSLFLLGLFVGFAYLYFTPGDSKELSTADPTSHKTLPSDAPRPRTTKGVESTLASEAGADLSIEAGQANDPRLGADESDSGVDDSVEVDSTNDLRDELATVESSSMDSQVEVVLDSSQNSGADKVGATVTITDPPSQKRPFWNSSPPTSAPRVSAPSRQDLAVTPSPSPSPTPTPAELPFVSGQSRGYSMLYAMQPEARATVEGEIAILLESRLRQNHIGVLVDGTFGWNPSYLANIITRLNAEERQLSLTLYLSNGPTQRVLDATAISTSFPQVGPEEYRELIQFDPATREEFRDLARRVLPIFALNRRLNSQNENFVVPMLEDNLDQDSYRAVQALTREVLGAVALTVRNPCPGCYSGNDASRLGDPLELHGREFIPLLQAGDAFSLDGSGYVLPGEVDSPRSFEAAELQQLIQAFTQVGLQYFGLWRSDRQGVGEGVPALPSERFYAVPTQSQIEAETNFLRFALPLEDPAPEAALQEASEK